MAIVFEANYSKKLGLPGYSSHQYSLTVRAELSDLAHVEAESKRLYSLLQTSVDREIQQTGLLPGQNSPAANGNGNWHVNGTYQNNGSRNGYHRNGNGEDWQCSPKQKGLILKMVDEHHLDKATIETLAQDRFGKTVRTLNKLEASGLIEELMRQTSQSGSRFQKAGAR
jgi:hypothetical protein